MQHKNQTFNNQPFYFKTMTYIPETSVVFQSSVTIYVTLYQYRKLVSLVQNKNIQDTWVVMLGCNFM